MLRVILSCYLILISNYTNAENIDTYDFLQEGIEFNLEWDTYSKDKRISFEYCPTNVCDLFVSRNPDFNKFIKFIDMYILYASGYVDLTKPSQEGFPPIKYIMKRFESGNLKIEKTTEYSTKNQTQAISCTMQVLSKELSIEKFTVVYDEGERVIEPEVDWRTQFLSVENIEYNMQIYQRFKGQ